MIQSCNKCSHQKHFFTSDCADHFGFEQVPGLKDSDFTYRQGNYKFLVCEHCSGTFRATEQLRQLARLAILK